jgi:hypothetical protein
MLIEDVTTTHLQVHNTQFSLLPQQQTQFGKFAQCITGEFSSFSPAAIESICQNKPFSQLIKFYFGNRCHQNRGNSKRSVSYK